MRLTIRTGSIRDYRVLAPLHYRGPRPAVVDRVLTAYLGGELVGVLVIARGVLNAPWRAVAWPGVFDRGTLSRRARALNARPGGVRCLARVIVDPRVRGMGVAARLVRAYLRAPITRHTEALAAMGRACPFFTRAGMTRLPPAGPSRRTALLARRLRGLGVDPVRLACPAALTRSLGGARRAALARVLRAWARASRSTRRRARGPLGPIAGAAAAALVQPPAVFVHTRPSPIGKELTCPDRRDVRRPGKRAPRPPATIGPIPARSTRRARQQRPTRCTRG